MGKRKPSWKAIAKKHFGQDSTYRRGDGGFALVTPCREVHFLYGQRRKRRKNRRLQ